MKHIPVPRVNAMIRNPAPVTPCRSTPFGGPASGLWPRGSNIPAPVTPTPAPGPSCTQADVFADCFAGDAGVIDPILVGPLFGWTWSDADGPKGGQITFTPGLMSLETLAPGNWPGATKDLLLSLASVRNITGQFVFTEFPVIPGDSFYEFFILNQDGSEIIQILFTDSGDVFIITGDRNNADVYSGTWTPGGTSHKVDFSISPGNVPTLVVDGVPRPLTFDGGGSSPAAVLPNNVVAVFSNAGSALSPTVSSVSNVFVTEGELPADTVYCCP